MINNFEEAVYEWLYKCPHFKNLYVATADITDDLDGQIVMTPEIMGVDDVYLRKYARNHGLKRYTVNIAQFNTLVTVPNTSENTTILDIAKQVQMWIVEQVKLKSYPVIGYDIKKIEPTGIMIAAIDENGGTKVQFQILIEYYYKEGK